MYYLGPDLEFVPPCQKVLKKTIDYLTNMVKYDEVFLSKFQGTGPLYTHLMLRDREFLETHNLAGDSLKEVLDSGITEDMHKAMLVLAKRGNRAPQVKETSQTDDAVIVEKVTAGNASTIEGVDVDGDVRERAGKRLRGEDDEETSRCGSSRRTHEPSRFGLGKSLTITGINKDALPPVLQSCSLDKPLQIEIQPNERWTAGSRFPTQVFQAFNHPQDKGSYIDKSRDEIADGCLARGGRLLADLAHIVKDYRADVDHEWRMNATRELSEAKEKASEAHQRAVEVEGRERKLISKFELLKRELGDSKTKVGSLEDELGSLRDSAETMKGKMSVLGTDVERLQGERDALKGEVMGLKLELEKAAEEGTNAMASGYQGYYDRLAQAGVDLAGHSLDDYCADLAKTMQDGDEGKGEAA